MSVIRTIKWSFAGLNGRIKMLNVSDDQKWLGKIAAEKITLVRSSWLGKDAAEIEDLKIHEVAMSKLTEQTVREMGAWFNPQETCDETDQVVLSEIAMKARDHAVCSVAVKKLTDQKILTKVASCARDVRIAKTAVEMITEQELLASIAIRKCFPASPNEDFAQVSVLAMSKITDQNILFAVADSIFFYVDPAGTFRQTNPAISDIYGFGVDLIFMRFSSQTLFRIAMCETMIRGNFSGTLNSRLRVRAVANIKDQSMLEDIAARRNILPQIRVQAIQQLFNRELLTRLANYGRDTDVGLSASERLKELDRYVPCDNSHARIHVSDASDRKPECAPQTVEFTKGETFGYLFQGQFLRGLWFARLADAQNITQIKACIAFEAAAGLETSPEDYDAVVDGRCKLVSGPSKTGGFMLLFPSSPITSFD